MEHPILRENLKLRLNIRLPLLICFAMFAAWQIGVIYFSGSALSIGGRTPLPVSIGNMTILIALGYAATIAFQIFLPRFIVWAERVSALAALLSALLLFVPLPPEILTAAYYLHCFCCVFMIGFETAIIVNLLTEESAARYIYVACAAAYAIVAVLQNDVVPVSFSGFRFFTAAALILMLVFFFRLPAGLWPRYVKRAGGLVCPKQLFAGVFLLTFFGSAMHLFGVAVAERVSHGVSVLHFSSTVCSMAVYLYWKRFGVPVLRSLSVLVVLAVLGFVTAILSLHVPVLSLLSCVLLGSGLSILLAVPLLGNLLAKRYPAWYISPAIILVAFLPILLHALLLESFRDSLQILYIIYLAISVCVAVLYLKLEPYLIYSFRGRSLITEEQEGISRETGSIPGQPENREAKPVMDKAASFRAHAFSRSLDRLSGQEIRLAEFIMQGYNNSEMAAILHITENTVKGYRKTLYSKLQIHSRRELFELAEKRGD